MFAITPPDTSTAFGRRIAKLLACRTDADYAALATEIRTEVGDAAFYSTCLHLVVSATDDMGYSQEQWRNQQLSRLGASSYRGLSDRQVARAERKQATASRSPGHEDFLSWLGL